MNGDNVMEMPLNLEMEIGEGEENLFAPGSDTSDGELESETVNHKVHIPQQWLLVISF